MLKRFLYLLLSFSLYFNVHALEVGIGKTDVTGPIAGRPFMGYGQFEQVGKGIHSHLYSKAYVFRRKNDVNSIMALVSVDILAITEVVKIGVIAELNKRGISYFNHHNLMIFATHTHAGPGGYFQAEMFNITTKGVAHEYYKKLTLGIAQSIIQGLKNLKEATISVGQDNFSHLGINRSLEPHLKNPEAREQFPNHMATTMTLLKIDAADGTPMGMINWYPMHCTSFSHKNKLVSSDSKGYAAYFFEKRAKADFLINFKENFIAAYANGTEGDISPHIPEYKNFNDFEKVEFTGKGQLEAGWDLYHRTTPLDIDGPFLYSHFWKNMEKLTFPDPTNPRRSLKTCKAATGHSFPSSGIDGPPPMLPGIYEGIIKGRKARGLIPRWLLYNWSKIQQRSMVKCQGAKPVLLSNHTVLTPNFLPKIIPFQVMKMGPLVFVALPGEMTTVAGYRLQKMIEQNLRAAGFQNSLVILVGLANSYHGYITTKEEYDEQNYEGAFTIFGPNTHKAYLHLFKKLTNHLSTTGDTLPTLPIPKVKILKMRDKGPKVKDHKGPFGRNLIAPPSNVVGPQTISSVFHSSFPHEQMGFVANRAIVQKLDENGIWQTYLTQEDPSVIIEWTRKRRFFKSYREAKILWRINDDHESGTYRFLHQGKAMLDKGFFPFKGATRPFELSL